MKAANNIFLRPALTAFAVAAILAIHPAALHAQSINSDNNGPWFKSDLHTHHTFREHVQEIVDRYRETGYDFVVLSTKDDQKVLNYEHFSTPDLMIVNGVEQAFRTRKEELGHVIGFRIKKPYPFTTSWTLKEGYEKLRKRNRKALLGINHPHDGRWTIEDIMEASDEGLIFFELNSIDMKHGEFSTDQWDAALSRGARLYATLVNDVHSFDDIDAYGYILVRAESLSYGNMARAMTAGDFYAVESGCSAKIERHEISETPGGRTLVVSAPGAGTIRIIADGETAGEIAGDSVEFPLDKPYKYVRAEIIDPEGFYTFMQPFFLEEK